MNVSGHKKKVAELERSLDKLLPDPEGEHVVASFYDRVIKINIILHDYVI